MRDQNDAAEREARIRTLTQRLEAITAELAELQGAPPDRACPLPSPLLRSQAALRAANEALERRVEERTAALRESEAHFRQLYDTMLQGVVFQDATGRILAMNPAAVRILGKTPDEFLGKTSVSVEQDTLREDGTPFPGLEHPSMVALRTGQEIHDVVMGVYNPREQAYRWISISAVPLFREGESTPFQVYTLFDDVTERKLADEALRRSEERYRARTEELATVLDAVPAAVWIAHDPQGAHITGNRLSYAWLGLAVGDNPSKTAPDGVRPETFRIFAHGVEVPPAQMPVQRSAAGEVIRDYEFDLVYPDGSVRHLLGNATPLYDAQGHPRGSVSAFIDISKRRRFEQEVRESEERFRSLFEENPAVILLVDPASGEIVDANRAASTYYGYPLEALRGLCIWDINTLPRDAVRAEMAKARAEERRHFTFVHRLASGALRDVEVYSGPVRVAGRALLYSIVFDVTERKQAEAERERLLDEVNRRVAELDAIIASVADGLVIYNVAGDIVQMNAAAERLMRYSPAERRMPARERIGMLQLRTFDGTPIPLEETPAYRALHGKAVASINAGFQWRDRAIWVSVNAAPIRSPRGEIIGAVASMTDITSLYELQQQQQLFVHLISHDLRAPLTIISGHAQLLAQAIEDAGLNGTVHISLDAITRGVRRMNTMIEDLVDSARAEGGQLQVNPKAVQLATYVPEMLQRSAAVLDITRIRLDLPADLPRVLADFDRLERIFINLLSNALKYSAPGAPVEVTARPQDGAVHIAVIDHGPGIDPADLPHLFERFYRGKGERKAEGIGLGLYITKLLVESHGGHIHVDSTPGHGSTFTFTLPTARE